MNREEFECHINEIEKIIQYEFKNKELLIQAITRKSYTEEHTESMHNEILEYFGDKILSAILNIKLVEDFCYIDKIFLSELKEEQYTNIYNNWSDNSTLAKKINLKGLNKYLIMNSGDEAENVYSKTKPQSDLFEAIVAAIYFDSHKNFLKTQEIILKLLNYKKENSVYSKNIISRVKEYCDINKEYKFIAEGLKATIMYNGSIIIECEGKNQKNAKEKAAYAFFDYLEGQKFITKYKEEIKKTK